MSKPGQLISQLEVGKREDELTAIVALIRSETVPGQKLGSIIDEIGSAVRVVKLSEADRLFVSPDASHDVIGAVEDDDVAGARRDIQAWIARRLDFRSVLDPDYPVDLHEIFNRPPLVFVRGKWPPPSRLPAVAVVGTRQATDAGLKRARRLATELVEAGFVVLSGLAAGIDTAAHTATLAAGGMTAAVFGTGLDRIYPAENAGLAEQILESGGALLSQFFPSQPPTRWSFPMRNVVMSGLSKATVVVEAGSTSGARMQARVALQHGRTVFLLKSLVEQHEWAAKYVNEGAAPHGTKAIEIASTADILARLNATDTASTLAVA